MSEDYCRGKYGGLLTEAVETNVDKDKVWREKARQTLAEIKGLK